VTRIPQLEQELVAAAARLQSPRRLVRPALRAALAAAAVVVMIVVAVVVTVETDSARRSHPAGESRLPENAKIEAVDPDAGVGFSLEGRVLTVRLLENAPSKTRQRVSGERIRATCGKGFTQGPGPGPGADPIQTRTRLWPAGSVRVRFPFRGDISRIARWCRLEDPVVGHVAFVKFRGALPVPPSANADSTPDAELSPEQQIEQIGNKWAPLFAAAPNPDACAGYDELHPYREVASKYMAQPACERINCERVANRLIKNCTPLSLGLQESFADATVQDVVIKGHLAAARFSNGETVELSGGFRGAAREDKLAPAWLIYKIGGNAGRKFFESLR
jgi:hypothetical protein